MDTFVVVASFAAGFSLGYVVCFYATLYVGVREAQKKAVTVGFLQASHMSPNKVFLERHKDRRMPDQEWGEQVVRAYRVAPTNKPVIKNPVSAMEIKNHRLTLENSTYGTHPARRTNDVWADVPKKKKEDNFDLIRAMAVDLAAQREREKK